MAFRHPWQPKPTRPPASCARPPAVAGRGRCSGHRSGAAAVSAGERRPPGSPPRTAATDRRLDGRALSPCGSFDVQGAEEPFDSAPVRLAITQLNHALGLAAKETPLPVDDRLALHASRRAAASHQLALLRLLRAASPAPSLSPAALLAALRPLARLCVQPDEAAFTRPPLLRAIWAQACDGNVEALLHTVCPLPPAALAADPAHLKAASPEEGPFDPTGRGERLLAAPPTLPHAMRYPQCASVVHLPPDFSPHLVTRSARLPSPSLCRAFVYGYATAPSASSLHCLPDGRVLYCVGRLAVLYDWRTNVQSVYSAHETAICAVAVHSPHTIASAQCASPTAGCAAWISVWESGSLKERMRLGWRRQSDGVSHRTSRTQPLATANPHQPHPPSTQSDSRAPATPRLVGHSSPFCPRSICCLSFAAEGALLLAVGTDDEHTVGVWEWRSGALLASVAGLVSRPVGVRQLAVAPRASSAGGVCLLLAGNSAAPRVGQLRRGGGAWGLAPLRATTLGTSAARSFDAAVFSAACNSPSGEPHGLALAGGSDGSIFAFDLPHRLQALWSVRAHVGAVRALCASSRHVASAAADAICVWHCGERLSLEATYAGERRPLGDARAIAVFAEDDLPSLLVGTDGGSIWRVERSSSAELLGGHRGGVSGVAPLRGGGWVSCGLDGRLLSWRPRAPLPSRLAALRCAARCVSAAGGVVAAGGADGRVLLLRGEARGGVACGASVEALALAADGEARLVAAASGREVAVHWLVEEGGALRTQLRCVCRHSSMVRQLDWAEDASMLMSNCTAREISIWKVPSGERLERQGGSWSSLPLWAERTSVLGFRTMGVSTADATGNVPPLHAAHESSDRSLLVVADDSQDVKLFHSPCVVARAPFKAGRAHAGPVSCVRFVSDAEEGHHAVVSCGLADGMLVLWTVA
ncbi:hypothetical protein AB1Y20_007146 [Prymnesium parvum]|uniref:EML-like second beta-propeller domain-containing protein n=1 Tax=Prymnesium parvum TaxID=97485 RepID=A0AB34IWK2_PRYPA